MSNHKPTSITFRSEGRLVYTPSHPDHVSTFIPVNPMYPSCPLGMRVSDLPVGWASSGTSQNVGEDNGRAKLTVADVTYIRDAVTRGTPAVTLAHTLGVNKSTISRVVRGFTWKV